MMKNFKKILATAAASTLVILGASMFALAPTVNAIPWSETAPGLNKPGFNVFTGVPGVGNEADFLRGRVTGTQNPFSDPVNDACVKDTQYSVQVYVHNGANQGLNNNGSGDAVAHGTTVKVGVPATTASKLTGTVSASNAPTVNDTLTINCNGKTMKLSYVAGTAVQQRSDGSVAPLSDSIVTTGAPIDSHGVTGDVWGCFDERVIVYLKVVVTEVPVVVPPSGVCKATDVIVDQDKRSVKATVNGDVKDGATVVGYKIDFGDGTTATTQTANHTYTGEGPYTITGSVQVKFPDGHTEWKTADACKKVVSFKPGQPPVTPVTPTTPTPTVLPSTGAGDMIGVFAAVTAAAGLAHRFILSRRFNG